MNLGYLMIPRACNTKAPTRDAGRAKLARALGFREFYAASSQSNPESVSTGAAHSEHAQSLEALTDCCERPSPQIASIDGERQFACRAGDAPNLAYPAVTARQVASNARARRATLSVSWLNRTALAAHWSAHVTGSTHAGVRARSEDWRIARTILVCDDPAQAEAAVKSKDSPCRAYYSKCLKPGMDVEEVMDACVLYGSLDSVLDDLHDILALTGPFGTLTLVDHAWLDEGMAQNSLAALASALTPKAQQRMMHPKASQHVKAATPHQAKAPYSSFLGRKLS